MSRIFLFSVIPSAGWRIDPESVNKNGKMVSMGNKYILYTDGGARGNPGPAAAGAVIYDAENNKIGEFSSFLGVATNNQAEYQAVILGLGQIQKIINDSSLISASRVNAFLDSELIVKQLSGEYRVKNKALQPLVAKLRKMIDEFAEVNFKHVPRENNKEADKLVNQELDKQR